ncbi:unnamed protein product [Strongylus vulgaris]|uniref:Uncharacterized protein n=1 Tax=Strongylus vulgaris TaxID=40348 RepID=A0A3P7JTU5_STRVU|nr:unnamed protein product [Strongylus vulgaris]
MSSVCLSTHCCRYYHIVHGFIVDTFLKTVRFLEAKRKAIEQWWEKDGRTQFGGVVDTVKVTAGVIYEIAKDVIQLTIDALGAFYHRVEVFVHNWSHHGLAKAIETGF